MKNLIIVAGMLAFSFVSTAVMSQSFDFSQTTVSGDVGMQSRYDYRGVQYSDDASLGLGLKVADLGMKGLYVSGKFDRTGDVYPFSQHPQVRSDLGVGYAFTAFDKLTIDTSLNHIYNAPESLHGERTEARVRAGYDVFYAELGQGIGVDRDTYGAIGVAIPVTSELTVGTAISAYHYKATSENVQRNTEIFASYKLLDSVDITGKYSFGGEDAYHHALGNYGIVGVSYNF